MSEKLQAKLLEIRAAEAARKAAAAAEPGEPRIVRHATVVEPLPERLKHYASTLDEVDDLYADEVESDEYITQIIAGISIVDAYQRWVPKPFPDRVYDNAEEIQVSCPVPGHTDKHPSASLNTRKNQWICYGCDARGDVIHLVGYQLRLDPRVPQEFMQLRKQMCRDLGYEFWTNSAGHEEILQAGRRRPPPPPTPTPPPRPAPEPPVPVDEGHEGLMDLENEVARGEYDKPAPEPLPEHLAHYASTLDELDDIRPTLADGRDKKDVIMNKLGARLGSRMPEKRCETAPKSPPNPSKPTQNHAKPRPETPKTSPQRRNAFIDGLERMLNEEKHPGLATKTREQEQKPPEPEPILNEHSFETPLVAPKSRMGPTFDWREILPPDTPLYLYLSEVCRDDSPEEYHIANYLQLIGLILGRDVHLNDRFLVFGTTLLCVIGHTGTGKSNSERHINFLAQRCMEFRVDDPLTEGIRLINKPGSGEYLTKMFRHEVEKTEMINGKAITKTYTNPSVRGLVRYPEMSGMLAKSEQVARLKAVVQQLYDSDLIIGGGSLTSGEYGAENPFGSLTTTTQPKMLNKIVGVNDVYSGFINRFWFIYGNPKRQTPRGQELILSNTVITATASIRDWARMMRDDRGGRLNFADTSVTTGSGAYFDEYFETFINDRILLNPEMGDLFARVAIHFKKLVLLFSANLRETIVSKRAIDHAKAYFEYLLQCYKLISGQLIETAGSEAEQKVRDAVQKYEEKYAGTGKDTWPTLSQIHNGNLKGSIPELQQLTLVVKGLVAAGVLHEHPPKENDRRSKNSRYSTVELD